MVLAVITTATTGSVAVSTMSSTFLDTVCPPLRSRLLFSSTVSAAKLHSKLPTEPKLTMNSFCCRGCCCWYCRRADRPGCQCLRRSQGGQRVRTDQQGPCNASPQVHWSLRRPQGRLRRGRPPQDPQWQDHAPNPAEDSQWRGGQPW